MKTEYIDHFSEAMAWMIYADYAFTYFGDAPVFYYALLRWNEQISLAEEAE